MAPGRFIVFEGGEGTGKSTQIGRLADNLSKAGIATLTTREPGGTPFAETIRAKLLAGDHAASGPDAEAVLISAGRIDHLDAVIRPALAKGTWVLCDRFTDSTLVYQGRVSGGDPAFLPALNARVVAKTPPDLTIVIDLPASETIARLVARPGADGGRWDEGSEAEHATIREAFLDLANADPTRHVVVDGIGDIDAVADRIWSAVQAHFLAELA